jgi:hypothetical protein
MRLTVAAAAPTPDQFLHTLLHQLAPHLVNAPAADLATVLQQLGALRYIPPEPWLTGVLSGAEGKLSAAGDQVSGGVWELGGSKTPPCPPVPLTWHVICRSSRDCW